MAVIAKRARSVASYEGGGGGGRPAGGPGGGGGPPRPVGRAACGSGSEKRPVACRQTPNLSYVPFVVYVSEDSRLCD